MATAIKISRRLSESELTLSLKMGGHSEWSSDEIAAICELLDIQQDEIGELFFPQMKKGA